MMKRRAFLASTLATASAASLPFRSHAAAAAPKLFDTHCHFYTNDVARYPLNPTGARYGAERMTEKVMRAPMTPEAVFSFWDKVGIEMGTGVQYNSTYGTDNTYLLDVCRQNPRRAMPVVILSPTDPKTPDTLRKWAKEERLTAVRYSGQGGEAPFFSPEAQNMWATANELGLCVVLMILSNYGPGLRRVAEHADRYPNVKIALDHIAFPHPATYPDTFGLLPEHMELARRKNVYYKFTSFLISEMEGYAKQADKPMVELKPFIEHMVKVFGADHLCWGSDYGNVEVDDVAYVKRFVDACSGLTQKDRSAFFAETARSLFVPGGRGKSAA